MGNSPLVSYTCISPNRNSPRLNAIDRITIHCVVGQCSVETLGNVFLPWSRQASSNYGVGYDGRIGMYCPEGDRSWCSSSPANDHRAVTIEVASDNYHPYAVTWAAYEATIKLCADICKRNGKNKLLWFGDANTALNYNPKPNEMVMTAHRWFASTICPGDYLYSRFGDIANRVNALLGSSGGSTPAPVSNGKLDVDGYWGRKTTLASQKFFGTVQDGIVSDQLTSCKQYLVNCETASWQFTNGSAGSLMIKAMQKWLGVPADGYCGPQTIRALQTFLGVGVDGYCGPITVKAWQTYLNKKV